MSEGGQEDRKQLDGAETNNAPKQGRGTVNAMNKITKTTTDTKNVTHDRFRRLAAAAVVAAAALWGTAAGAADVQQPAVRDNAEVRPVATQSVANKPNPIEGKEGKVSIMVNKSLVLATKLPYKTVNVANPDVVDFN